MELFLSCLEETERSEPALGKGHVRSLMTWTDHMRLKLIGDLPSKIWEKAGRMSCYQNSGMV